MIPARLLEFEGDPERAMDNLAQVPEQLATLEVDVEYIKRDVSEIKVDLKGVHEVLGKLDARLHQNEKGLLQAQKDVTGKIHEGNTNLSQRIEELNRNLTEKIHEGDTKLSQRIEEVNSNLTERIDGVELRLTAKIDSAKLWALALYVAQAGSLLFVLAKGFKWI